MPEQLKGANEYHATDDVYHDFYHQIFVVDCSVETFPCRLCIASARARWNLNDDKFLFSLLGFTRICMSAPLGRIIDRHISSSFDTETIRLFLPMKKLSEHVSRGWMMVQSQNKSITTKKTFSKKQS